MASRPSTFRTYLLPIAAADVNDPQGQGPCPRIAEAWDVATRVVVTVFFGSDLGGALVAYASSALDQATPIADPESVPGGAYFLVRPKETQIFILAPGQQMYAAGNTINVRISVAQSEAYPAPGLV